MSWPCQLIERAKLLYPEKPQVGDMWFSVDMPNFDPAWSPEYLRDWKDKRPILWIKLPGGSCWCIDHRAYDGGYKSNGWTITGDIPVLGQPVNVTASPSINVVGCYHGWLQNGVLSDDVEGRTFNNLTR